MKYDPDKHHRRSIRLQDYDYAQEGAYFITICSHQREWLFGDVIDDIMYPNTYGEIVAEEWLNTGKRPNLELDLFVVMPNHFHAIVLLNNKSDMTGNVPTKRAFAKPEKGSLGTMIGAFKSAVTKRVNVFRDTPSTPFWQCNYHEYIIRNQAGLNQLRQYIIHNPALWNQDRLRI